MQLPWCWIAFWDKILWVLALSLYFLTQTQTYIDSRLGFNLSWLSLLEAISDSVCVQNVAFLKKKISQPGHNFYLADVFLPFLILNLPKENVGLYSSYLSWTSRSIPLQLVTEGSKRIVKYTLCVMGKWENACKQQRTARAPGSCSILAFSWYFSVGKAPEIHHIKSSMHGVMIETPMSTLHGVL